MRLFVSIDLPSEIIRYISGLQKKLLKEKLFEGTIIPSEQLHVTLAFIGEIAVHDVSLIQNALHPIEMPVFQVCLGNFGVFLSKENIRIIWIDLQGKALHELAKKIRVVLSPLVKLEERSFVSHVTVARVKKINDKKKLCAYLESISVEPLCFTVHMFMLKESILSNQGAEHSIIEKYALN